MTDDERLRLKAAAGLLDYPDHAPFWPRLTERRGLLGDLDPVLATLADTWTHLGAARLAAVYVETFDFNPKAALYLTIHELGNSPRRGGVLVQLAALYRQEGFEPPRGELADYLPALLELAALASDPVADGLKTRVAEAAAQIEQALDASHPYRPLFGLIRAVGGLPPTERPPLAEEGSDVANLPYPLEYPSETGGG